MASIQQTSKGWRVQLSVQGRRDSATFQTKREAQQWAAARESELRTQAQGGASTKTLADALHRYADEVSSHRRGWRWEHMRLAAFEGSILPCSLKIGQVTSEHIAAWRDARIRQVAAGTVLRELGLLSSVFTVAVREWRWLDSNPVGMIRKPRAPAHRERLITWSEIRIMLRTLGHRAGHAPRSVTQAVARCFVLALRTGMRAGELTALTWDRCHASHVRLDTSKTGVGRDVPLSSKARRALALARGWDDRLVVGVAPQTLDVLFRRARDKAGLSGFTFHDSRHVAATWLGRSGRVEMLEMCKIFGWRDPKHALIYFNPSTADLADKLG